MLETKIKVALKGVQVVEIGQGIQVKPFLSRDDQDILMQVYMFHYFEEVDSHVLDAEYALFMGILDICTNIKLTEEVDGKDVPVIHIDRFFENYAIVKLIRNSISNYGDFRALLRQTVDFETEKRKEDYALGKVLSELGDRATSALDAILSFDSSDESMAKIRELISSVETSPIMKEAIKIFKDGNIKEEEKAE